MEPNNYRPFLLLPLISKVIQRELDNHLMEYLEQCKIIFYHQSHFSNKHLVNTCLSLKSNQKLKRIGSRK